MATSSIALPRPLSIVRSLPVKLCLIALLIILADWLFFGRPIGVSVALFVTALAGAVLVANPMLGTRREILIATGVLFAALLPVVESLGVSSILFAAAGLAYFALAVTAQMSKGLRAKCMAALTLLVAAPYQIFADAIRAYDAKEPASSASSRIDALVVWFAVVFLVLFASANPIIELWFLAIDPRSWLARLDFTRVLFWCFAFAITWPFVWMRARRSCEVKVELPPLEAPEHAAHRRLFGEAAILRSLVLFNLLFAVQTCLDIAYLWRGVSLPHGMTYASYAHRGAYPLVITALLAAAFVIAAMRPGSTTERMPLMRALVFLWIAQNVLLVISSMLRLDLYVQIYSLTYLRTAAFIWMLLVAAGLVLIITRILLGRSNAWLVSANLTVLILTLYICSFVNFAYVIASYNVAHSWERTGEGSLLDLSYIASLGPQAIPAMDRYVAQGGTIPPKLLPATRNQLAAAQEQRMQDWRAWTFRDWRLDRYLAAEADASGALQR
jgi:hypothetical protein